MIVRYATALAGLLLAACTEYADLDPRPTPPLTPAEMSALVPTAEIAVADTAFARMVARPREDIEIPATLTLWRGGQAVCAGENVELQIKGNFSAGLPAKALGVKFDRAFRNDADDFLRVPRLREGHSLRRIKSFRLRNGGSAFATTLLKDLAYARMVIASDLDVLALYGEPAATYVNGAFYSLHNLRTENNENGVSRLLDVDEDRLGIVAVDAAEAPLEIKGGEAGFWRKLEGYVDDGDAAAALAAVDARSFADFLVAGMVFATQDWPWRNVRMYAVDEGPVRFVLYDFDFAGQAYSNRAPLAYLDRGPDGFVKRLYELCYRDADFRALLERRYAEVVDSGQLSDARLREELTSLAAVVDPVIAYQIARYGQPASVAAWYVDLEATVGDYALRYGRLPSTLE